MEKLYALVLLLCVPHAIVAQRQPHRFNPRYRPTGPLSKDPARRCTRNMADSRDHPYQTTYERRINKYVQCDAATDEGGWIIFQRRKVGDVDFNRTWKEYKFGFGKDDGDHWLGLKYLNLLLRRADFELLIEITVADHLFSINYPSFKIGAENTKFALTISGESSGNLQGGECYGIAYSNGMKFSTKDDDNDWSKVNNCADLHVGGWWYKWCNTVARANLNGLFGQQDMKGMFWSVPGGKLWVQASEMKMRRTATRRG